MSDFRVHLIWTSNFFCKAIWKNGFTVNKPRTIQELKENVRTEICLYPETIIENAVERVCICEHENGNHLRDAVTYNTKENLSIAILLKEDKRKEDRKDKHRKDNWKLTMISFSY